MTMKVFWIIFFCLTAVNTIYLSYLVLSELVYAIKKKKKGLIVLDDYDLEDEDADEAEISYDEDGTESLLAICPSPFIPKLKEENVQPYIKEKLLAGSSTVRKSLTLDEVECAVLLLSSLIKHLLAEAPEEEQTFSMLLELLESCEPVEDWKEKDGIELLLEMSARSHRIKPAYYGEYLMYKALCERKEQVIKTCSKLVAENIQFCEWMEKIEKGEIEI